MLTQTTDLNQFIKFNQSSIKSLQHKLQPNLRSWDYEEWYSLFLIRLPYILKKYNPSHKSTMVTYIAKCLKNVYGKYCRDKFAQKRFNSEITYVQFDESLDSTLNYSLETEQKLDMASTLSRLPLKHQQALNLFIEGFNYKEIAGATGMSIGWVHNKLNKPLNID